MVVVSRQGQQEDGEGTHAKERTPQITLLPDRTFHVASIDSDLANTVQIRQLLAGDHRYEVHSVTTLAALLTLFERVDLDCAVISGDLEGLSAFSVNEKITMACPNPPATIMVVGEGSERTAVKAFRSGFADYLKKGTLDAVGLRSAVAKAANARRDRRREKEQVQVLSDMAMRDSLTGLANRNALEEHLAMMMESGVRYGKPFCVILIDIDHFKSINDTFGHFVGDHALKEFAKKLKQSARTSDAYGRLGGDEFLYLIGDGVSVESIRGACDRLFKSLTFTVDLDNIGFSVNPSIGAAIYPIDGKTASAMLEAADRAMYRAKTTRSGSCLALELQAPEVDPDSPYPEPSQTSVHVGDQHDEAPMNGDLIVPADGADAFISRTAEAKLDHDMTDTPTPQGVHRLGNRREDQRHRVLKKATIYSLDGLFSIDCVVRDLSAGGARLAVSGNFSVVPDHLTLLIAQTGEKFTAEKRWQRGEQVGLMFTGSSAPARPRPAIAAAPVAGNSATGQPAPKKGAPRAFIIDDDPQICGIIAKALSGRGYIASEYATLSEVEAALALVKPELIVLDLTLGETDAIDVMKKIAASRFTGHILLISGHDLATLDDVHKIGERGGHQMLPVLQKPFRLQEFRARLDAMEMPSGLSEKDRLLGLALQNGWLEVWYQPKIDLRTMAVCGSEALARIRHPDRGVLLPREFLPPPTGRISQQFSEFVLETALKDWRKIAALSVTNGGAVHRIAVNVPASYILSPGFVDYIKAQLPSEVNFPGFIIEIPEDETISDPQALREIAVQLRLNNIAMSIDDFGSGQSTVERLAQLPFAELKLDRSYVHGCAKDKAKKAVCQYVLDLAHGAGMLALAEGVEDPEDLDAINTMGFDLAQGFVFAKAMTRDDLIAMLTALQTSLGT